MTPSMDYGIQIVIKSPAAIVASAPASDGEMGVLSLHVARPSTITAHSPATISVDDEGMGYLSLKGAYYRAGHPARNPIWPQPTTKEWVTSRLT